MILTVVLIIAIIVIIFVAAAATINIVITTVALRSLLWICMFMIHIVRVTTTGVYAMRRFYIECLS